MDLVVTVPKWFWFDWIAEGDAVGEPETGEAGYERGLRDAKLEASNAELCGERSESERTTG